jgi:hypothetical protein
MTFIVFALLRKSAASHVGRGRVWFTRASVFLIATQRLGSTKVVGFEHKISKKTMRGSRF